MLLLLRAIVRGPRRAFRRELDGVEVALYELSATTGALPRLMVPVPIDAPVRDLSPGVEICVHGPPLPGRGLTLEIDGVRVPCAGPAWVPTIFRNRFRL
jgi:hypothetical protein